MGYSINQVEQATKNCKELSSRGGGIINADAIASNPDCQKKTAGLSSSNSKIYIIGGIALLAIGYFIYKNK